MNTAENLPDRINQFIDDLVAEKIAAKHLKLTPSDDLQFIQSGLMDSVGFLEFLTLVEDEFEVELDFEDLDPAEFLVLGGFKKAVMASVQG